MVDPQETGPLPHPRDPEYTAPRPDPDVRPLPEGRRTPTPSVDTGALLRPRPPDVDAGGEGTVLGRPRDGTRRKGAR